MCISNQEFAFPPSSGVIAETDALRRRPRRFEEGSGASQRENGAGSHGEADSGIEAGELEAGELEAGELPTVSEAKRPREGDGWDDGQHAAVADAGGGSGSSYRRVEAWGIWVTLRVHAHAFCAAAAAWMTFRLPRVGLAGSPGRHTTRPAKTCRSCPTCMQPITIRWQPRIWQNRQTRRSLGVHQTCFERRQQWSHYRGM